MSRRRELLDADPVAGWLGITIVEDEPDRLVLEMAVREEHCNFLGGTHGAVVFGLADVGMSLVSNTERTAVAIDAHVSYTAPSGPGEKLTVELVRTTGGRTAATHRGTITRSDGRTVGLFTGTTLTLGSDG